MQIVGVRRLLIDLMCQVAIANHPNEFVGVLIEKDGIIEDRTGLINGWFREKLAGIDGRGRQS